MKRTRKRTKRFERRTRRWRRICKEFRRQETENRRQNEGNSLLYPVFWILYSHHGTFQKQRRASHRSGDEDPPGAQGDRALDPTAGEVLRRLHQKRAARQKNRGHQSVHFHPRTPQEDGGG